MKYSYLFVIALLSQGCILKKLAVSNADIGIESQIEKRLPLYSAQKDQLSLDTDKFLNETKPKLKSALPLIQTLVLHEDKMDSQYSNLKAAYVEVSTEYIHLLTKYMALLDEKQQKGFWENFDEFTSDFKRRTLEQQEEKLEDRFEMFFGDVTPAQLKLLKAHARYQISNQPESLQQRQALKEKIKAIYAQPATAPEKSKAMSQIYLEYQNTLLEDQATVVLLKSIVPTLSTEQRKFFKDLSREVEELIAYFLTKNF